VKGFSAMAGLHSATGKRTRLENELADTNDRNKRRNNDSGREQAWPVADSIAYRILCPGNVVGNVIEKGGKVIRSKTRDSFENQSCRCCSRRR